MNYLYNGAELPALPETAYPHAVILRDTTGLTISDMWLWLSTDVYAERDDTLGEQFRVVAPRALYYVEGGEWKLHGEFSNDSFYNGEIIWTNRDLIRLDGSVYLAASDPIPVTTAAPIDPTSFMQGWLVGRRIAAMRGKKTEEV